MESAGLCSETGGIGGDAGGVALRGVWRLNDLPGFQAVICRCFRLFDAVFLRLKRWNIRLIELIGGMVLYCAP